MSTTSPTSTTTHDDQVGPIDIVVIAYPPGARASGEAFPLLLDLVDRGIIRVLDALFVIKEDDGTYSGFEASDLESKGVGDFVVFEGASSGLLDDEDLAEAGGILEPGNAAGVVVYENTWAAPFAAALRRSGAQMVASGRIPVQDLITSLEAAEAAA